MRLKHHPALFASSHCLPNWVNWAVEAWINPQKHACWVGSWWWPHILQLMDKTSEWPHQNSILSLKCEEWYIKFSSTIARAVRLVFQNITKSRQCLLIVSSPYSSGKTLDALQQRHKPRGNLQRRPFYSERMGRQGMQRKDKRLWKVEMLELILRRRGRRKKVPSKLMALATPPGLQ